MSFVSFAEATENGNGEHAIVGNGNEDTLTGNEDCATGSGGDGTGSGTLTCSQCLTSFSGESDFGQHRCFLLPVEAKPEKDAKGDVFALPADDNIVPWEQQSQFGN